MALKAEGVKFLHHLALGNGIVQTAVGVGAGVLGVLLRQCGKALLGLVAGIKLGQDLLRLFLGGCFGLIGVIAVCIGLGLDENVADLGGGVVVIVAADKGHNSVALSGGILDHGHVSGLAAAHKPFLIGTQAAACRTAAEAGLLACVYRVNRVGKALEHILALGFLVGGHDLIGGLLGGGQGLFGNFLGGLFALGLRLNGDLGGFYGVVGVIEVIIRALKALILLFQLRVGVAQGFLILTVSLGGKSGLPGSVENDVAVHAVAVVGLKVIVGVGEAHGLGVALHAGKIGVDLRQLLFTEGDAVFPGVAHKSLILLDLSIGRLEEIILPGGTLLKHGAGLIRSPGQTAAGVQAEDAGVVAVLVDKGVILVCVVVIQLCGGVGLAVDGGGGGVGIEKAGVEKQDKSDKQHDAHSTQGPVAAALGSFLCLFLCGQGLLVRSGGTGGLAIFLFR